MGMTDNLSFGLNAKAREAIYGHDYSDPCSGWYKGGGHAGTAIGLAMGGAHAGRNIVAQMGRQGDLMQRIGRGVSRFGYDNRRWGSVRRTWSASQGGLRNRGMHLHHVFSPQRGGWSQGFRNAGFNYLPISGRFNSWMNGSTATRRAVERGFRATVGITELSPLGNLRNSSCD